jgi:regulatory protein
VTDDTTGAAPGPVEGVAPVIPLFGASAPRWHPAWTEDPLDPVAGGDADADDVARVEAVLVRRLRGRQLSSHEAGELARREGLAEDVADALVARLAELGYLDDAGLADRLVEAGADRRGQGRNVIAQTLAKRGIPRELADAALAQLPDDDLDRALDYARSKVRSLRDVDAQAALRRLAGQLARRGYSSSVALTAARRALEE